MMKWAAILLLCMILIISSACCARLMTEFDAILIDIETRSLSGDVCAGGRTYYTLTFDDGHIIDNDEVLPLVIGKRYHVQW